MKLEYKLQIVFLKIKKMKLYMYNIRQPYSTTCKMDIKDLYNKLTNVKSHSHEVEETLKKIAKI